MCVLVGWSAKQTKSFNGFYAETATPSCYFMLMKQRPATQCMAIQSHKSPPWRLNDNSNISKLRTTKEYSATAISQDYKINSKIISEKKYVEMKACQALV